MASCRLTDGNGKGNMCYAVRRSHCGIRERHGMENEERIRESMMKQHVVEEIRKL